MSMEGLLMQREPERTMSNVGWAWKSLRVYSFRTSAGRWGVTYKIYLGDTVEEAADPQGARKWFESSDADSALQHPCW